MKTEVDTAVLKHSAAFSEAPSQTPSTSGDSSAVNQVAKDIKKMKIKDPVDRSSVSYALNERLTAEPRQTNQDPLVSVSAPHRGLLNLGATCYLNAALQVLFMTEAFRERVLLGAPSDTSEKLLSALKELFEELSSPDRGAQSVSTKGVIKALGVQRIYEQQDAVEYFLEILEKAGPNLAEVFTGTMRNSRVCAENHKSHDDSSFKSIQIALNSRDGPYRVEDGVQSYFESTALVGDDQMYCDICQKKSDTIWSCEIHEYPTILALHLKRFVYDYRSYGFVKNDCPLDVPLHLSLQEQEYSLYAVINHSGSRFGGHYTTVVRSLTDNKCYCLDDSRVAETDESKLKRSREAYLLLYQKIDSPPVYEMRSATLPGSDAQVEDMKEEPKTKTAEAKQCSGAHSKPQAEGHLRIVVLRPSETESNTLLKMILSEIRLSSESQLWDGKSITDSLEICSPGPHMMLWVAPLENSTTDEAFEEVYRLLGDKAREYMMIVFTSKGHPTGSNIKNAMLKYAGIKNHHVLDMSADLIVQVKELVTELTKIVEQNQRSYYVKKTQKRKHEPHENTHEKERTSRKKRKKKKKKKL